MTKCCCVVGCKSRKDSEPHLKFFILPREKRRRSKWLKAINRAKVKEDGSVDHSRLWEPKSRHTYVCSRHFITGAKVNMENHPDYVPSIFKKKEDKSSTGSECKVARFERASRRSTTVLGRRQPLNHRQRASLKACPSLTSNETESSHASVAPQDETDSSPARVAIKLENSQDCSSESVSQECESGTVSQENQKIVETKNDIFDQEKTTVADAPMSKPLSSTERAQLYEEIQNLRAERDGALQRVAYLEKLLKETSMYSESVEGDDEKCQMMTGINWTTFMKIYMFLCRFVGKKSTNKLSIPLQEQLFLTLVRLRHNLSFELIAFLKGIPKTTAIDYFWRWIDLLNENLGFMIKWPDRENIRHINPSNRFSVLKGTLSNRVKSLKDKALGDTLSNGDKILRVCAILSNVGSSIVFDEH
ncbi:THAP domain-containing protein 11-like [Corythoichthys intestinalis]|uniref:THAP domain-containing protein 11-like n=1 Tax=Corythoichthys intestinalis TaxID=161448 RepID=UPI0025A61658|nr:THAP domain-containing protein 11-like [Corythoichthys intestinalis]